MQTKTCFCTQGEFYSRKNLFKLFTCFGWRQSKNLLTWAGAGYWNLVFSTFIFKDVPIKDDLVQNIKC